MMRSALFAAAMMLSTWACTQTEDEDPKPSGPPTVTVPPATYVSAGTSFTLTAQGADPAGGALTYAWEQKTGAPLTVTGGDTATLQLTTPTIKGDLVFRVTVTNAAGQSAQADTTLWVRRDGPEGPVPLRAGRVFRYQVREQVYPWVRDSAYLDPTAPQQVGTASLTIGQPQLINGIKVWPYTLEENTTAVGDMAGSACVQAADETACGSPNLACVNSVCVGNKPLVSAGNIMQVDAQLYSWVDANTAAVLMLDPSRTAALPYLHDGFEWFSNRTRVAPMLPDTPIRYLGDTALGMVGAPVEFTGAFNAPCVEVFDGTRNPGVLSPYRMTRAFYQGGVGLTFFQWESVPRGFESAGQVGYRDAVLVAVESNP